MKEHYVQAPLEHHEITLIECKAKRNKPAKRKDVPKQYRKYTVRKIKLHILDTKEKIIREIKYIRALFTSQD
jgi:hypothetical protein